MKRRRYDPAKLLATDLLSIEKPARYLGGELGSLPPLGEGEENERLIFALSFPDLYEIGMSNNAIRILYDGCNRITGLRCERVFAPAPDFEKLLTGMGLPLATLESGIALADVDLLGFSVGYELAATSILTILSTGAIPLLASERGEGSPIVIAGGPAVSNPHYLSGFLDAVFIGEAEGVFFGLLETLAGMRKSGASRAELLASLGASKHVWMPGKNAVRAIFSGFPDSPYSMAFPVPVLKAVQGHGTVEIMRGCPHGCRFCHAGFYYRPQRMKDAVKVKDEVRALIEAAGYREVTLASLSSGDYEGIGALLASLNEEWGKDGVSFQLPSLKVNTFTLPLIESLSEVRKSGLTFAVESPEEFRQVILNKDVSYDKIISILTEAKARGFKLAKFYFMIGLPVPGKGKGEAEAIVSFMKELVRTVPLSYNVNVGVFVPKPHTPFQWCGQLPESEGMDAIHLIREGFRHLRSVKLSWHSPFAAALEAIFSRGDERVGEIILEAWKRGARLDAWEEHFDRELWRSVIESRDWKPFAEAERERSDEESFVWDDVSIRVSKSLLLKELTRSRSPVFTSACEESCSSPCGSCQDDAGIVRNTTQAPLAARQVRVVKESVGRLVLRFSKTGIAAYYPHLGVVDALERAFRIVGLSASMSQGFNPGLKLEVTQPLPLGVISDYEIAVLLLDALEELWLSATGQEDLKTRLNRALPRGLAVTELSFLLPREGTPTKRRSLGSLYAASSYLVRAREGALSKDLSSGLAMVFNCTAEPSSLGIAGIEGISVLVPASTAKEAGLMRSLARLTGSEKPLGILSVERKVILAEVSSGFRPLLEVLTELN